MLADNLVEEEFEMEDEPWYDHRDLQQGEGEVAGDLGVGIRGWQVWKVLEKFLRLEVWDARPGASRAHLATDPPIPTVTSKRARPTALRMRHTG